MTFTSKLLGAVLAVTLFTPSLTFAQAKSVTTKEAPPKSKAKAAAAAPTAKEIADAQAKGLVWVNMILYFSARCPLARSRRNFLKNAAAGAAAMAAVPSVPVQAQQGAAAPRVTAPSAAAREAESGAVTSVEVLTTEKPGSDFMVDVLKSLGIEYLCSNPGSSFRGLHESFVNYGGNKLPEFITCCHEESAVGMAHGYAKIEGKPLMTLLHATVGTMHASMAIYNAYCDRVPVFLIAANSMDATTRRP